MAASSGRSRRLILSPTVVAIALAICQVLAVRAAIPDACTSPEALPGPAGVVSLGCGDGSCEYDNNLQCSWILAADPTKQVEVSWQWIDVETSNLCGFDSVSILAVAGDGTTTEVQKSCGDVLPTPTTVTLPVGSGLMVQFVSDSTRSEHGFGLAYAQTAVAQDDDPVPTPTAACGDSQPLALADAVGEVGVGGENATSYPADTACSWTITPDDGDQVRLAFMWLNLAANADGSCGDTYVELKTPSASRKECGSDFTGAPSLLTDEEVTITFVTASPDAGTGFRIQYTVYKAINGPQFVTGYPSVVSSDTDRVRMDIMVVWPGTVYVMVLPGNSDAPSVAAVIAGTDPNSVAAAPVEVNDEFSVRPIQLTGLDAGTAYDVYFAIQNFENPPKESAAVTLLRVETTGVPAAPAFAEGYPTVDTVDGTSATLKVMLADVGRVWWVVVHDTTVGPTSADVVAGTGSGGAAAVAAGTTDVAANTEVPIVASGLAGGTAYTFYVVAGDVADPPHVSEEPMSKAFTTTGGACYVSQWGAWTACSADCGGGTQDRSRTIVQLPSTGFDCPPLTEQQTCNEEPCVDPACVAGGDPVAVAGGEDGTPATFGVGTRGVQLPVTYSSCQWVVPCAADETLRVWFNWIQLEDTDEACQHNYIEILNGESGSTVLMTACGSSPPHSGERTSHGEEVVVRLHYTLASNTSGFEMGFERTVDSAAVDCQVGEWGEWTPCSSSCGEGTQTRERAVLVPPSDGGQLCPNLLDHQACNMGVCLDPACDPATSPVSLSDGNGTIAMGGIDMFTAPASCSWLIKGAASQTVHLWFDSVHFSTCHPDGVHVYSGTTQDGAEVLTACGPELPDPIEVVGKDVLVTFVDIDFASNPSFSLRYLVDETATPQDCVVSEWSTWGACSAECGGGTQERTRVIDVPAANGGSCDEDLTQSQACNTFTCETDACGPSRPQELTEATGTFGIGAPGGDNYPNNANCQWRIVATAEQNVRVWFTWLSVERTTNCADDYVKVVQESDGAALEQVCGENGKDGGAFDEVEATGSVLVTFRSDFFQGGAGFSVSYEVSTANSKVDCETSEWTAWSTCSAACGGGTQTRSRTVTVPASNGGTECGDLTGQQDCNTDACTNPACGNGSQSPASLSDASGDFGFSSGFGSYPANVHCAWLIHAAAGQMVSVDVQSLNLAPAGPGGQCSDAVTVYAGSTSQTQAVNSACGDHCASCPVVVSPTDDSGVLVQFTTSQDPPTGYHGFTMHYSVADSGNVDCVVGEWGDWGACSATCGGGTQSRTQTVAVPAQGSGKACTLNSDTQACNTEACNQEPTDAATVVVIMRHNLWQNGVAPFVESFRGDLSASLDVPAIRIAVLSVGGYPARRLSTALRRAAVTNPLAVVFEVLPAKEGSEVGAIVNAFQQQLADPTSQLRQGVVTKFLDDTATPDVTYAAPAQIKLDTTMVVLKPKSLEAYITITNAGVTTLVVSSIAQNSPTASWLTVTPSSMTLGAKQASQIHVSASTTSLAAGDYFQVVSLEHNDPSGTHAFGVQLLNGEAKSNDEPSVLESKGFVPGILTGAGMLLVAALLVVGLVVLVQRKVLPCVRRTLGLRPRPQERFKRLESNHGGSESPRSGRGLELKSVAIDKAPSTSSLGGDFDSPTAGAGAGNGAGVSGGGSRSSFSAARRAPQLVLAASPTVLAPHVFETRWEELSTLEVWGETLNKVLSDQELENTLAAVHVVCMASGVIDDMQKYYFYAETQAGVLFMAEVSFSSSSRRLSAVIKGPSGAADGASFVDLFKHTLGHLVE